MPVGDVGECPPELVEHGVACREESEHSICNAKCPGRAPRVRHGAREGTLDRVDPIRQCPLIRRGMRGDRVLERPRRARSSLKHAANRWRRPRAPDPAG